MINTFALLKRRYWAGDGERLRLFSVVFFLLTIGLLVADLPTADEIRYRELQREDMLRQADNLLLVTIDKTWAAGDSAAYLDAVYRHAGNLFRLREDAYVTVDSMLSAQIARSTGATCAVLRVMRGNNFLDAGSWRTSGRSAGPVDAADLRTWDERALRAAALREYDLALRNPAMLKGIPSSVFSAVISPGDNYPGNTLLDAIACSILDKLKPLAGDVNETMVLGTDWLCDTDDFLGRDIPEGDSLTVTERILRIHRLLVEQNADNRQALATRELERLQFVFGRLTDAEDAYDALLDTMMTRYADIPQYADFCYERACLLASKCGNINYWGAYDNSPQAEDCPPDALVRAVAFCREGKTKYGSSGGSKCAMLLETLTSAGFSLSLEDVQIPGKPFPMRLQYKNLDVIEYVLYPVDYLAARSLQDKSLDDYLYGVEPLRTVQVSLPAPPDYRTHTSNIIVEPLPTGAYVLKVNAVHNIMRTNTFLFQVTSLQALLHSSPDGQDVFVVNRDTGEPVAGVRVHTLSSYRGEPWERIHTTLSDNDGYAMPDLSMQERWGSLMLELANGTEHFYCDLFDGRSAWEDRQRVYGSVFTDRSLYRPGQTVHYWGVRYYYTSYHADSLYANKPITVILNNPNGRRVGMQTLQTDDWGFFSGSFELPNDGLPGVYTIKAGDLYYYINVEEYKRPTFEVELDPIEGVFAAGDSITVHGRVTAYAGYPVGGAEVHWSATARKNRLYWWPPISETAGRTYAQGRLVAGADGSFSVTFRLTEDTAGNWRGILTTTFVADVTDSGGETRSAQLSVNNARQEVFLDVPWPDDLDIRQASPLPVVVRNAQQRPVSAQVQVKVESLSPPEHLVLPRNLGPVDVPLVSEEEWFRRIQYEPYGNEQDMAVWRVRAEVLATTLDADTLLTLPNLANWAPGAYRFTFTTRNSRGETITAVRNLVLYSAAAKTPPVPSYFWVKAPQGDMLPGQTAEIIIGSSLKNMRVIVEIDRAGSYKREVRTLNNSLTTIRIPVTEADYGNIYVTITGMKHNCVFSQEVVISVPWVEKHLQVELTTFRRTLVPGQKETWKLTLKKYRGAPVRARLAATLYDASLDAYLPHDWSFFPWDNRSQKHRRSTGNERGGVTGYDMGEYYRNDGPGLLNYKHPGIRWEYGHEYGGHSRMIADSSITSRSMAAMPVMEKVAEETAFAADGGGGAAEPTNAPRTNFAETAFFYPNLQSDATGLVSFSFTMPDALTRWKLLGLAVTADLAVGDLCEEVVTQKQLMAQPNPPRFLRMGDETVLPLRIVNMTADSLRGMATLELLDAFTLAPLNDAFSLAQPEQAFSVGPNGNTAASWRVTVPEGPGAVVLRCTARGGSHTDVVELTLPVLPGRMLITETLPMALRGGQTQKFTLRRLARNGSPTLRSKSLTLEFTSNPAWLAVLSLPYIGTPGSGCKCADSFFNSFYVNTLGAYIIRQHPAIGRVFAAWRDEPGSPALLSNLERNQDLKTALLEDTPWVRNADWQTERNRRVGRFFDENALNDAITASLDKLQALQNTDGGWPWFEGMESSVWMTTRFVIMIGELNVIMTDKHQMSQMEFMCHRAVNWLEKQANERYRDILAHDKNLNDRRVSYLDAQYLYAHSLWRNNASDAESSEAREYFLARARDSWQGNSLYLKCLLALALHNEGDTDVPDRILASLRDAAIRDDEMGWHWKQDWGWWWYSRPIESHALAARAFNEIAHDIQATDEIRLWLLKNKQTNDWGAGTATADACRALLMNGTDWLAGNAPVSLEVGGQPVVAGMDDIPAATPGTGWFRHTWSGADVTPARAEVMAENPNPGPAWGALYWQYYEDLDRIEAAETPLKLKRELLREETTTHGPLLAPIHDGDPLRVGDKLVVRLTVETDRDMEYVHLMDMRAAGTEPLDVLSGCEWRDGLCYYRTTGDVSTDYFIQYLPHGLYRLEYRLWAAQAGNYRAGISSIQCYYAPEFSAHSEGSVLNILE